MLELTCIKLRINVINNLLHYCMINKQAFKMLKSECPLSFLELRTVIGAVHVDIEKSFSWDTHSLQLSGLPTIIIYKLGK